MTNLRQSDMRLKRGLPFQNRSLVCGYSIGNDRWGVEYEKTDTNNTKRANNAKRTVFTHSDHHRMLVQGVESVSSSDRDFSHRKIWGVRVRRLGRDFNFKIGISAWAVDSGINPYALCITNGFVDNGNSRLNDGDVIWVLSHRGKLRFAVNGFVLPKVFKLLQSQYKLTVELFDRMELEILAY